MDRTAMLAALQAAGVDTSTITDAVPDEALAQWVQSLEGQEAPAGEKPAAEYAETPPADGQEQEAELRQAREDAKAQRPAELDRMDDGGSEAPPADGEGPPSREAMCSALEGAGYSKDDLDTLSDEELARLYDAEVAGNAQFADGPPEMMDTGDGTDTSAYDEQPPSKVDEGQTPPAQEPAKKMIAYSDRKDGLVKLSELKPLLEGMIAEVVGAAKKETTAQLAAINKQVQRQGRETKRQLVRSFCENLRDSGRLAPAMFGVTFDRLMRADNTRVQKFSDHEGKAASGTELERQMAELELTPQFVAFAERIGQPLPGAEEGEVEKVKRTVRKYSDTFRKNEITEDKAVAGFKIARRLKPGLTARDHLGLE